jgi:hypothetical protein
MELWPLWHHLLGSYLPLEIVNKEIEVEEAAKMCPMKWKLGFSIG